MTRKSVVLSADERAICRVRYRQVATYMDPGPQPMTPNDRICQAIAAHYKNGTELEHGKEYSDLLFPFGNKRAGGPKTVSADCEIARRWVEEQPVHLRGEIFVLLGFAPDEGGTDSEAEDKDVQVKDEEVDVKQEEGVSGKRKFGALDTSEEDSKEGVLSKRPRADAEVKIEADDRAVKTED
ncbi:hypothetical protein B0H16DRAFT_1878344 [Mycena metata]|uniref:Uncharacterized protein n=1 Tax=Mycena metata TaxID=1033252 RepID=A0AAD7K6T4_9AGAR|nr:hypothetical protein B0H16DRAFT_1878344 [Mycena metata]